jgi:ethanolamine utilization microcompartment shell protein EutS
MTTLTGRLINNTYKQLLKIGVSTNTGITGTLQTIQDGDGSATALQLATSAAQVNGTLFVGKT